MAAGIHWEENLPGGGGGEQRKIKVCIVCLQSAPKETGRRFCVGALTIAVSLEQAHTRTSC